MNQKQTSFYNTNKESGLTLEKSKKKALSQEQRILTFFETEAYIHPDRRSCFTPENIRTILEPMPPLTSIRRALTNLTIEGFLEKTDTMAVGQYGKMIHTWRLK